MFIIRLFIFLYFIFLSGHVIFSQTSKNPNYHLQQKASLIINEFMASNVLSSGNTEGGLKDWIEIYNPGDSAIDLEGYYLTDDLNSNKLWKIAPGQSHLTKIQAKGFLIIYADEQPELGANHIGFKLSKDGGQIALIDKDGHSLLDSITYSIQFRDISFGRYPDGSLNKFYFNLCTPGKTNKPGHLGFAPEVKIDLQSGFYSGSTTAKVSPGHNIDTVRYTLDGSDPNESSEIYTSPVQITKTTVFKARAFSTDKFPSHVSARTFIINTTHTLPVLVLLTDPQNLYDPQTGIYVNDKDGLAWERYSELEYFKNQALKIHAPAGLRIQGNTGPLDFEKKSFRAYFRDGYGLGRFPNMLYSDNMVTSFNRLVFRAGYDDSMLPGAGGKDTKSTLLRDPLVSKLWERSGQLVSQSSFSVLYLNEKFNGIYDIKESLDENFVKDHLGYRDLDMIRTRWDSTEMVYGRRDKWNELISFFSNNSFESDIKLAEAARLMDIDNFATLLALIHTVQYSSWAYGTFIYRERTDDAQWKWLIWDADRAFTDATWNGFGNQTNPTGVNLDNLITKKLFKNQTFRNKFINRTADLLNTVFSPQNVKTIIDSLALVIAPEIPAEVNRWNNSVTKWNENVELLRVFASQRPSILLKQIIDYFNLKGQSDLTISIKTGKGKIQINTITVDLFPWTGKYLNDIPVKITAIPEPGFRFSGWNDPALPDTNTINLNLTESRSVLASFTKIGNSNVELISPKRIIPGQTFPIIVRIRDQFQNINPEDQAPVKILFNGAHADTSIQIKRGAGTGLVKIDNASAFTLSIQNDKILPTEKNINVFSNTVKSYSGTLQSGTIIWDNSADRHIISDLTIPTGCTLIIKPGTWVMLKKYVNIYIKGKVSVEGNSEEPVIFTSEKQTEPWGGMEFDNASGSFNYCIMLNGGGDLSKGSPTNEYWHTGHQHIVFGKNNSEFKFDQCFFLYSKGKAIGAEDSKVTLTNSVFSFVWLGGEFHRVLLFCKDSHLMNLPNDDHIYTEDIDTDGFHIDYVNSKYPQYSIIDRCYFVTGKDDAIDHHFSRLKITNCWLEDFVHEGVAASGGDTVKIFNTVAISNDQGFEDGWTEPGSSRGPIVLIDHCVAANNNVGLRIGDSYTSFYNNYMKVTNSILYNNKDNILNYLNTTKAPLKGALEISYSMTNDSDYDNYPGCITGNPQFDSLYYLRPGSRGWGQGMRGTNLGRTDSGSVSLGSIVINEIMYKSHSTMDSKDWIELYNPLSATMDISGWILKDDDDKHSFAIPSGTIIPAGGFRIICMDTLAFKKFYDDPKLITGNIHFGYGNSDQVRLYNSSGMLIDSIKYNNSSPWPIEPDGKGNSLVLINPYKDHFLPSNWTISPQFGGSPGTANFTTDINGNGNKDSSPNQFVLSQNYPNPFNPSTRILYSLPHEGIVTITIFNLLGQNVTDLLNNHLQPAGNYSIIFNGSQLSSGVYFFQVKFNDLNGKDFIQTRKMILMK